MHSYCVSVQPRGKLCTDNQVVVESVHKVNKHWGEACALYYAVYTNIVHVSHKHLKRVKDVLVCCAV